MRSVILIATAAVLVSISQIPFAPNAQAGCHINVGFKNISGQDIRVYQATAGGGASSVKSRYGSWRKLKRGRWGNGNANANGHIVLSTGNSFSDNYRATFRCNAKRRYRFNYRCWHDATNSWAERTVYFPSPTGWTQSQSIVADLSC